MNKEKLFEAIKKKVGDMLIDEQINGIVDKFNLENGEIPEIVINSDPYKFEKNTRQRKDIFEHSWAGSTESIVNTDVLIGDYKPGIDEVYEYSQNGDSRTPEENHEMSDFSVNQIQVAVVMDEYSDHFNGNDIEEYSEKIQIYLPDEKEYTGEISFKNIILHKRKQNLTNEIRKKVGGKLTDEQINGIVEKFNLESGEIPEIVISSDPYEFEKNTRRKKNIFEHSWAGSREDIINTDVLIGDYKPGIDDVYEYSQNGDSRTPEENHEMSDFSVNQIQVAVVMDEYSDHFNGNDIEKYSEKIQIYLPDEKEYAEGLSFAELLENGKSELETKEQQLINLEDEAKKISELEALIYQQKDGQDKGEK